MVISLVDILLHRVTATQKIRLINFGARALDLLWTGAGSVFWGTKETDINKKGGHYVDC
jgi:hypothetical protein